MPRKIRTDLQVKEVKGGARNVKIMAILRYGLYNIFFKSQYLKVLRSK